MTNSKKLHVLIIPSWYPRFKGDVGGSFFREQGLALHKAGANVGVVFPQINSLKSLQGLTKLHGIEVSNDDGLKTYRYHFINITPGLDALTQKRRLLIGMKLFERYIKDNGMPDIIHAHSLSNAGLLAKKIHKKYTIPYIVTEHFSGFLRNAVSDNLLAKLKPVVENASKCIAVSHSFKDSLNRQFATNKWSYLPNVVSDKFLQQPLNLTIAANEFTFLSVCFLNSNKKIDILLRAFSIVCEQLDNVRLQIGGDGPEKAKLESLAINLNISDKVDFLGSLNRDAVVSTMANCSAFVSASEFETFGVVIVEALALGKPVIATKCGGPESIIIPSVGYLVDTNSPSSLADAMLLMHANQGDFEPDAIRSYCRQEFSEKSVISRLTCTYNNVLNLHE